MTLRDLYERTERWQAFKERLESYGLDDKTIESIVYRLDARYRRTTKMLPYQVYLYGDDYDEARMDAELYVDEILKRVELGFKSAEILLDEKVRDVYMLAKVKQKLMNDGYSEKEAEELIAWSFDDPRVITLISYTSSEKLMTYIRPPEKAIANSIRHIGRSTELYLSATY